MFEKPLRSLAKIQEKNPLLVLSVILIFTLFLGYYAVRLGTDSSFNVMFTDDSDTVRLGNLIKNEFGGTDSLFVLVKIDNEINSKTGIQDIRHPDVLKAMVALEESLREETFVNEAFSLADLLLQVYGKLPESLEESKSMISNLPEEVKEQFLGSFLSKDFQFLNMFVSVNVEDKPGFLQKIQANVEEKVVQTPFPIGVQATLTGLPILINRIMNLLINDNIRTILLAIIGVFIILWIYFKSWKISLFSIIPLILTLIWLSGTLHLMDIRITIMIASVGAMMVGMSVDYAIHITHGFHESIREGKENAVEDTVVGVGGALIASVATTAAGFLAMLLGVTPNSTTQGKVLAIGIAFAFIASMLALPPLMVLQRKFVYSKLDEVVFKIAGKKEKKKKSPIDILLGLIAKFQVKRPKTVLIFVGVLTILIIPGFGLVYLDTDDEGWIPQDDPVLLSLEEVGFNFGGTESMNFIFMLRQNEGNFDSNAIKDLRDPRVLLPMSNLDKLVEELQWVDSVDSPSNDIKSVNRNRVPQDLEQIKRMIEENPGLKDNFNDDFSIALFTYRFDDAGYNQFFEVMGELDGVNFPDEIEIIPQGSVPEDIELESMLGSDTMRTAGLGFVFVIIIATLFYLSFTSGMLAFFPIIFAILWTIGTMGYINLPFTVLTTGMLAILMGMGIDFSIHIMHSIKRKMKEYSDDLSKAIPEALQSTGQAIAITTITTVVGFLALTFANLINTRRLGWTLALGIFFTFFSTMLIVPAVLVLQYKKKTKEIGGRKMKKIISLFLVLLVAVGFVSALQATVNNYDPQPAEAGKAVNVWFKVENDNDDADENVFIEIIPKDGLRLTSGEQARQSIGIMPGRSSQIVQYRLLVEDDAFDGSHNIEVRIGTGTVGTSTTDLSIEVTDKDIKDVELAIGDIESDPSRIKPDDDNIKLEVIIQNLGDGRAQGVKAELVGLPKGVSLSESYSGTSLLGNIDADSTSTATFFIDVDKKVIPKEHLAQVKVSDKYKPDEEENELVFEEKNLPLRLAVKPVPIYEITNVELFPEELTAGDDGVKLKLTIKNVGEETGESVRLKAFGKSEQPIEFDIASDFISPMLDPGEEGQATLEFDIIDDANLQIYWLDLEIKSVVNDDVITYNEKVSVEVINPKPNNPWRGVIFGIIIIVVVVIFIWRRNKNKNKAKPKKVSATSGSFLDKVK